MTIISVNAIGDPCPIPVVKTIKALEQLRGPAIIEVQVDNEMAVQNITKLANSKKLTVTHETLAEKHHVLRLAAEGAVEANVPAEMLACTADVRANTVAVFDADTMGSGDDDLGKTLLKGFLYALAQLETLPDAMLFYNGGARLTVEGSVSLEDIRSMQARGVEVLTCGTCLNYYGLSEKLAVGSVTNMYTIVEKLAGAQRVIRP